MANKLNQTNQQWLLVHSASPKFSGIRNPSRCTRSDPPWAFAGLQLVGWLGPTGAFPRHRHSRGGVSTRRSGAKSFWKSVRPNVGDLMTWKALKGGSVAGCKFSSSARNSAGKRWWNCWPGSLKSCLIVKIWRANMASSSSSSLSLFCLDHCYMFNHYYYCLSSLSC